ncbi:ATP-binding protein [Dokdonella sp.]|uniref:sensor histidine kinase n=1 Tax=Dokdonella sp. TaxID=2291710 RepID=UPI003527F2DC
MNEIRPRFRGLVSKLALFYALLSLPTLIIVEGTILFYEFQRFTNGVQRGSLDRVAERGASDLSIQWSHLRGAQGTDTVALKLWLDAWILRLQQPRGGLTPDESYILLELGDVPLGAAIYDQRNELLARTEDGGHWQLDLPTPEELAQASATVGQRSLELAGAESDYTIKRILVPLRGDRDSRFATLFVELRIPVPWRHVLFDSSFESPTVLVFLVVFGLASSFFLAAWVTRRLSRIARAARAWSRGDFSDRIDDRSSDEIGGLSSTLDRMAVDLKSLLRSRAQLAILAERQRLARDLHDTVKQKAFALNLQLATMRRVLGDSVASERLELAQRLTQQIQQELAQILDEMRASDAELPFAERLRMRANDWAHTSGASLGFAIEDVPALAQPLEDSLLRIVDEALSNVLRHSGAEHVDISLRREADRVSLSIADNGRGAAEGFGNGMGLRNMRERSESLPGGSFSFDSVAGRGTVLTIGFQVEVSR